MRTFEFAVAVSLVALAPAAFATEIVINQKEKQFSEKSVTLKAGDSIKFVNDDDIAHDVHSATAGYEFDLGSQQPGTAASYTFANPGTVKVRCAIHPKMKLDVVVE
jgi:plastocyanin